MSLVHHSPEIPHVLRVGALAVASPRANAAGTVRLSCSPDGLGVDLLQVGRFAAGFAMLGLARPVSFRVPFTAVRGLVRVGPALHLALDPAVATPYNRFALCRFSTDPHAVLMQAFRVRAGARLLSLLLPVPMAALTAALVPRAWVGGPVGLAALAAVVAWAAWRGLTQLVNWLTWGGPASERLRERFEHAVAHHLGLEPAVLPDELRPEREPEYSPAPARGHGALRGAWAAATRPRAFVAVCTLGLIAGLGAVLAVQRYGVAAEVLLPVDRGRTGAAGPVRALFEGVIAEGSPRLPSCVCQRTVSPLWRDGIPLLSILIAPRKGSIDRMWVTPGDTVPISHGSDAARDRSVDVEFELAVVNNSAAELDTVSLVVTFAQRSASGRRTAIKERGLHWPAKLRAGRAVKWSIEAEGTEFRVDSRLTDKLGMVPAARADAFYELRDARLMPVRVHGAMMLAYLGDSRARQAAETVGPLTAVEERVRAQILRSLEPLRTCDWKATEDHLSVCVHNGSRALLRVVELTERGATEGAARTWRIEDWFHPGRGLRAELPLEGGDAPHLLGVKATPYERRGE